MPGNKNFAEHRELVVLMGACPEESLDRRYEENCGVKRS
jgi:hypothetical protein